MRKLLGIWMMAVALTLGSSSVAWADIWAGVNAIDAGDYTTAQRELLPLAERGNVEAQWALGHLFKTAKGSTRDLGRAAKWFLKAAENGDSESQYQIGTMYLWGDGVVKNPGEGAKWIEKAVYQAHEKAQFTFGAMYESGLGVKKDFGEAAKWYRNAAKKGLAEAKYLLAKMYSNGTGVEKNEPEATRLYREAAIQGFAAAQNSLGVRYEFGVGIKLDYAEALNWYRKAAEQGHKQAEENLAALQQLSKLAATKEVGTKNVRISSNPDDVAVIIGNSNYKKQGKNIPNVSPAYADATAFKEWLINDKGLKEGNVIFLEDATGSQIVGVFGNERSHKGQLFNWAKPNTSNVYIYYAGHGAPGGKNQSAMLVPTDSSSSNIELTGYSLETLYKNLSLIPAKSITLVLESCFSGASQNGYVINRTSGILIKPKMPSAPKNITVISAGQADQVASWEQDDSHSLFTKYFLSGMKGEADKSPYGNADGEVGYDELEKYLGGTMTYYARRYYGRDQVAQFRTYLR
jgi:TPR repeat protein